MNGVSFGKRHRTKPWQSECEWRMQCVGSGRMRKCTKNHKDIHLSVKIYNRPDTSPARIRRFTTMATWVEWHATFGPRIVCAATKKRESKYEQIWRDNITYRSQFRGVSWDFYFLGISTDVGVGDVPEWYQLWEGGVGWGEGTRLVHTKGCLVQTRYGAWIMCLQKSRQCGNRERIYAQK